MKKSALLVFRFLLMFYIISCNFSNIDHNENVDEILTKFDKSNLKSELKCILVIPLGGCSSCFDKTSDFIRKNISLLKQGCLIVFTNFNYKREVFLSFKGIYDSTYMLVDETNYLSDLGYDPLHPSYLIIENEKFVRYKCLNPLEIDIRDELINLKVFIKGTYKYDLKNIL